MPGDHFYARLSNTIGARGLRWTGKLNTPIYRLSGGRLMNKVGDGPVLLLTTTGRKSGEARTAPVLYLAHGDDFILIDTNGGNDPTPSNPEASHYAPLQQLATDLANNAVAPYTLITPDQFNDSHTALTNGFDYHGVHYTGDAAAIAQGDNFLSQIIPQIEASQAYKNNGAIVIWWDETEGTNQNDFSHTLEEIVISPLAKGNAYVSTLPYTHSSDLKSLQELFNVSAPGGGFLGDANTPGTNDLSDLFQPGALTPAATPVPEPSSLLDVLVIGVLGASAQLFRKLRKSC